MNRLNISYKNLLVCLLGVSFLSVSCTKDLLKQEPTTDLGASAFWQTEDDATYALNGAYNNVRACFDRDYNLDTHGEYTKVISFSGTSYGAIGVRPYEYGGSGDTYYGYLYGAVNRANYVIDNVRKMLPSAKSEASRKNLEAIVGEARLLRGMVYFRLICLWGDVPGIWKTVNDNSEVASISRTPIGAIKDSIIADFTNAYQTLPERTSTVGRAAKPAALAFRGKMHLYWASWNKNGWPELEGFTPNASEVASSFAAAAADFKSVVDDYGLTLFRNGEPGECDELGKAEKLPNYYHLFLPTANGDGEMIMAFTHGGTGSSQSEALMYDFGGVSHETGRPNINPYYELADRYQSILTGDFCEPLIPMNPTANPDYFTRENSALNPQSYANRDYRMKSSIMWDYEPSIGLSGLKETGWVPFLFKTYGVKITAANYANYPGFTEANVGQTTYSSSRIYTGYAFRKYVRNYAGDGASAGNFNFPVMRLADVYLMYAEAINEVNNGPDAKAIELVNKIRHRGNLPPLADDKTATKDAFFDAVEQERIVELLAEGQRGFDLRRWRAIERVWDAKPNDPVGKIRRDTYGTLTDNDWFQNKNEIWFEQLYIFKIPQSERDKNPNLTQNTPWL